MGGTGKSEKRPESGDRRALHRLSAVRKLRNVSLDDAARQLELTPQETKHQEQPTTDLTLSALYRWQELLKVPVGKLLVEGEGPLGLSSAKPDTLAEILRGALLILQHTKQPGIRRMAHTLVDQLVELSPGLREIADAHTAGQAHRFDEQGRAMKGALPLDFFLEPIE